MIGLIVLWLNLPTVEKIQAVPEPVIEDKPKLNQLNDYIPLTGHTLLVGRTGSGKSNVLMSQIIRRLRAKHQVTIVDSKREFKSLFKKHCTIVTMDQAEDKFIELIKIADERMELFSDTSEEYRKPCRNATEYRKLTGKKLPTISIIVDELIVLMSTIKESELIKLLVLGRSSEVFVICASQYIKADILSRKGIVNFTNRVFLGDYDRISCSLIFDSLEPEDTKLIRDYVGDPGKAALMKNNTLIVVTMPEVTDEYLEEWL